mmetsp:Transcript_848/g.1741  ORF Transcript_848/g.1741 Transcript_848/m.1741 type:complete len:172 (-) Transcript_848:159-674(-)
MQLRMRRLEAKLNGNGANNGSQRSMTSSSSAPGRLRPPSPKPAGAKMGGREMVDRAAQQNWNWCLRPKAHQLDALPPVDPMVRMKSEGQVLFGQSMLTGEQTMMFGRNRNDRPGIKHGRETGPFFGVPRPAPDNTGRMRGGGMAHDGWAGTSPNKAAGLGKGRVICDGRSM